MTAVYTPLVPVSTILTTPTTSPQAAIYQSLDVTDALSGILSLSASAKSSVVQESIPTSVAPLFAIPERPTQTIHVDTAAFPDPRRAVIMVTPQPIAQEYYIQLQIQSPTPKQVHVAIGIGAGAGVMMMALVVWLAFVHWRMKHVLRRLNFSESTEAGRPHRTVSPYDLWMRPRTGVQNIIAKSISHSNRQSWSSVVNNPARRVADRGPPPSYPAPPCPTEEEHTWSPTTTTMTTATTKYIRTSLNIQIPSTPAPLAIRDPLLFSARSSVVSATLGTQPPAYTCHSPFQ